MDLSQGLAVASVYDPWPFDSLVAEHMATQPGNLAGEDYRGCERDSCDGMANDGSGNMDVDGVGVGGGVTLAMARGAATERGVGGAQRNSFLELQGGAGASIGRGGMLTKNLSCVFLITAEKTTFPPKRFI